MLLDIYSPYEHAEKLLSISLRRGNNTSNRKIYFSLFSEITHRVLKILSQYGFMQSR